MTKFVKLFHLYTDAHGRQRRRRRVASLVLGIGLGLIVAAVVAAILYWMSYGNRFRN